MDTSDETIDLADNNDYLNLSVLDAAVAGPSNPKDPEEQANEVIKNAERAKERMFEVPGRQPLLNSGVVTGSVASMDEDYQMIDAHVEESFKLKIVNWEYIDFSKLLSRGRTIREDEHQCLEIINKNGLSYLSPVSDRQNVQINSYAKWEQAFRVYSNIITSRYPEKAPELLQYNHTLHSASLAYITYYRIWRLFNQFFIRLDKKPNNWED